MKEPRDIARFVKQLCEERGTNISTLEKEAHIANGVIGKWKDGRMPRLDIAKKVATYLGITVDELLMTGDEKED